MGKVRARAHGVVEGGGGVDREAKGNGVSIFGRQVQKMVVYYETYIGLRPEMEKSSLLDLVGVDDGEKRRRRKIGMKVADS